MVYISHGHFRSRHLWTEAMIKLGHKITHDIRALFPALIDHFRQDRRVLSLYLFGSYARKKEGPLSDIDIALLLDDSDAISLKDELHYLSQINEILNTDEVSFVILNEAPLMGQFQIVSQGEMLYSADAQARCAFEQAVTDLYIDFRPILEQYDEALIKSIKGETVLIDHNVIMQKISVIRENIRHLRELATHPLPEFSSNFIFTASAERLLQVAIEACFDIGHHIIASEGFARPQEYREIFEILGREKILPISLVEKLVPMARFRNRLVHLYDTIKADELYMILQRDLDDFEEYIRHIVIFLEKQFPPPSTRS